MLIVKDKVSEPLYAVVPSFNPWRYRSREKHTLRALKHFADSGAVVIFVEIAYGRREFAFHDLGLHGTPANCGIHGDSRFKHQHIQFRTKDELWLKENAINRGISHLPPDCHYICWLDADVHFLRPNWVGECIHKLQHHAFIQMFTQAQDVAPNYEMLPPEYPHSTGESFVHAYRNGNLNSSAHIYGKSSRTSTTVPSVNIWPGLAWACTRPAFESVGGLFDVAIWGGGDYDMAHALIEEAGSRIHKGVHRNYRTMLLEWEDRCRIHIRRNVGVMSGTLLHFWHGKKTDRKYLEKRLLMRKVNFDPLRFLKRDFQGLWQLHDDGSDEFVHFRDEFRRIAYARNEDSIDI